MIARYWPSYGNNQSYYTTPKGSIKTYSPPGWEVLDDPLAKEGALLEGFREGEVQDALFNFQPFL